MVPDACDTVCRGLLVPDLPEARSIVSREEDIVSVAKIATDIEMNAIIFYQKPKEILRDKEARQAFDKIIKEEERRAEKLKNTRLSPDFYYAGITYGKFS